MDPSQFHREPNNQRWTGHLDLLVHWYVFGEMYLLSTTRLPRARGGRLQQYCEWSLSAYGWIGYKRIVALSKIPKEEAQIHVYLVEPFSKSCVHIYMLRSARNPRFIPRKLFCVKSFQGIEAGLCIEASEG